MVGECKQQRVAGSNEQNNNTPQSMVSEYC